MKVGPLHIFINEDVIGLGRLLFTFPKLYNSIYWLPTDLGFFGKDDWDFDASHCYEVSVAWLYRDWSIRWVGRWHDEIPIEERP